MLYLVLVKHGQSIIETLESSDVFPRDSENRLTDLGRSQIEGMARQVAGRFEDVMIYSSPSPRCEASAEIVSRILGCENTVSDNRLRERDSGDVEVTSVQSYRLRQSLANLNPLVSTDGGESAAQHRARVEEWLFERIARAADDSAIVVISHGTVIEHLHSSLSGHSVISQPSTYAFCAPGHFHLWSLDLGEHRLVLGCQGVNCDAFPVLDHEVVEAGIADPLVDGARKLAGNAEVSASSRELKQSSLSIRPDGNDSAAYHR